MVSATISRRYVWKESDRFPMISNLIVFRTKLSFVDTVVDLIVSRPSSSVFSQVIRNFIYSFLVRDRREPIPIDDARKLDGKKCPMTRVPFRSVLASS